MKQSYKPIVLGCLGIGMLPGLVQAQAALEEIIVTAERRASTVQDTAAAITALSGDSLRELGVVQPNDLGEVSPSIHATVAGANTLQFYIRGVGNFASNQFAEGAVAFNVDGIYVSRPWTYAGHFYDLERVEVLKGPQGTLYGRNATGGAVNLITRRPEIGGAVSGELNGQFGNYDNIQVDGGINIPVNEKIALRGAFQVLERDGYFDDGGDDAGSWSARLSALIEPNEDVSVLVVGDYQNVDSYGSGSTITGPGPALSSDFLDSSDPWSAGNTSAEANALLTSFGRVELGGELAFDGIETGGEPFNDVDTAGILAQLDWNLGFSTLTLLSAYRDSSQVSLNYSPGFLLDYDEEAEQTSFEARLASNADSDALEWVAGFYYFDENIKSDILPVQQLSLFIPGINPGENSTNLITDLDTESWALFGQATYSVTEALRFVGGLRYSEEDKNMSGINLTYPPFDPLGPAPVTFSVPGEASWDDVTWKVGVEYDVTPENLLYFNVSTGFKAGGFYGEQEQFGNTYKPEEITAYALGSKNRFMNDRLQLNIEAYYWDYTDHQESHLALSPGGYAVFQTENIGQAEMKGLDVEGEFLITENDRLGFQLHYLDAEFVEFNYNAFSPGGLPLLGCPARPNPSAPFFLVDCDGQPAVRAPEWAATLAYQHSFEFENGSMILDLRTEISDGYYVAINYLPASYQDNYTKTSARLTYLPSSRNWSIAAWVRNIEDEPVISGSFTSPFTPLNYSSVGAPRTFGISTSINF